MCVVIIDDKKFQKEIRNTVKELDRACRKQNATINQIHANPTGPGKNNKKKGVVESRR